MERKWEMPVTGWMRVGDARKRAVEQIVAQVRPAMQLAFNRGVTGILDSNAERHVGSIIRTEVNRLTKEITDHEVWRWENRSKALPSSSSDEKIVGSEGELESSEWKLEVYRSTASYIGARIGSGLADLGKFATRASQQAFRQDLADAVCDVLQSDAWLGYYLGRRTFYAISESLTQS